MGNKANVALVTDKYDVLVSMRYLKNVVFYKNTLFVVAVIIAVLIVILYWFFGTELGCSIRSTGSNENMSRAQGINTDLTKIIGLMLSNGIVALGSIIYYLVLQVVLWFGLNSNDLKLLSAIVVAVFLAIPYMKRKYFSKPVKKGGARRA